MTECATRWPSCDAIGFPVTHAPNRFGEHVVGKDLVVDGARVGELSSTGTELADPESMRIDPNSRTLYWSSDGKREVPRTVTRSW